MNPLITYLNLLTALGCGLIAGVFFAFSSFVMKALAKLPPAQGIAAMQSINVAVINPVFMGVLLGTAVLCVVTAVLAIVGWSRPGSGWMLAGALLYLIGSIGVTMTFHVPRNDALALIDPLNAQSPAVWANYVSTWTAGNHARMVASLLAAAAYTMAFACSRVVA